MNLFLQRMLNNAKNREENSSAPPHPGPIRAEKQDRPLPDDLKEQLDLPYGDPDHALFGDVVYPKDGEAEALPVIVFVHGGALVTGNRKTNRVFCQECARRGFVVYSVDYRLLDRADAFGMVSDLCDALAMVRETAKRFHGDLQRVSLFGESAGAFLALYATAEEESESLRLWLGCRKHGLPISRLVLISGMIYTTAHSLSSFVYKNALYSEKLNDPVFLKDIDPENPVILSLLPPVFLVTSKSDFLRSHTMNYYKALERNHHECRLRYYPEEKELTHAFPSLMPSLPESRDVLDEITDWINGF